MTRERSIFRPSARRELHSDAADNPNNPVTLYMDEAGNGNRDQPLIVGAIAVDSEVDDLEVTITELYRSLKARRSLRGLETFDDFVDRGFHATKNPPEVRTEFLRMIGAEQVGFKAYMVMTSREGFGNEKDKKIIEKLYVDLLADILIRYSIHPSIKCFIEQNSDLRGLARRLPDKAALAAVEKLGRDIALPPIEVVMVEKMAPMSVAVIDYLMWTVAHWEKAIDCASDPSKREFRAFREIEPSISMLYSVERGMLSTRKHRA